MVGVAQESVGRRAGLIVVLSGAECAGKTTLARALAESLATPLVDEYAREYLSQRTDYDEADLTRIARTQAQREMAQARSQSVVVVDTDVLVIRQWSLVKYGRSAAALEAVVGATLEDPSRRLYLVPRPDIPWEPDPLREHPHLRMELHRRHLEMLAELGVAYLELVGTHAERLAAARAAVAERLD